MVEAETTRGILLALAGALPDEGEDLLTGLEVRDAWGGALLVRVHSAAIPAAGRHDLGERLRRAVRSATGDRRCRIDIVWGSGGLPAGPPGGPGR